jgi:hypothetical protein
MPPTAGAAASLAASNSASVHAAIEPARQPDPLRPDATTAETGIPRQQPSRGAVSFSSLLPWLWRGETAAPKATVITLTTQPTKVLPGRRMILHALVTSEGRPVQGGTVDFSVDGIGAGASRIDENGTAKRPYSTFISGTHEVLARFSGSRDFAASVSKPVTLTVSRER